MLLELNEMGKIIFKYRKDNRLYYTNNTWIDITNVPMKDFDKIDFMKCKNVFIEFHCADINGMIEIVGLLDYRTVNIKYNKKDYIINKNTFMKTGVQNIVFPHGIFRLKIGQKIKDEHRDYVILDRKYEPRKRKSGIEYVHMYKIHCNICGGDIWIPYRSIIDDDYKCSVCNNKIITEGINDIPTTAPWMIGYFQGGYDEAKLYTHGSHKKIYPKCPNCGNISNKMHSIYRIHDKGGFSCRCNDHMSYPEKFMHALLEQLKLNFISEAGNTILPWANRYIYDFYIEKKLMIIETHGNQHYNTSTFTFKGGRTYEEEQENDFDKMKLAINNGIKSYVQLDCRKSELGWIKKSIMNSDLPKLLKFKEEDICWEECEKYCRSSILIQICNYYNQTKKSPAEIAKDLNYGYNMVLSNLKKGTNIGVCSYNSYGSADYAKCKPIMCLDNNKQYLGTDYCAKQSLVDFGIQFTGSSISRAIKEGVKYHGYTFCYIDKDEYFRKNILN